MNCYNKLDIFTFQREFLDWLTKLINIFSMPLPHKKNFLRDVLPKNSPGNYVPPQKSAEGESDVIYHKVDEPVVNYNNDSKGRWRIWSLVVVAVFGLTIAIFYVFSSAEVVVTPRVNEATFDMDLSAQNVSNAAQGDISNLTYSASKIEKIGTKKLDADGEKLVERKASGTIIIYNNFNSSAQKLIKNTRFETPDGLIYRIDRSVVVPGRATVNGKVVPGSVEATVYADETGAKYNIGLTNFTIPGFKTDAARYSGFYASSKTSMLDGFSGSAKYVSDAKQKLALAEISSELEKQILEEVRSKLDKDSFIPNGAYTIEFETQPSVSTSDGKVEVKEKATVTAYAFKSSSFDQFLASKAPFASSIGSSTVEIINRSSLVFVWLSRPKQDSSQVSFRINGNVRFSWIVDTEKLAASLEGKKRGELPNVLRQWDNIVSATASLSPFWRSSFPNDSSKINVIIKLPED